MKKTKTKTRRGKGVSKNWETTMKMTRRGGEGYVRRYLVNVRGEKRGGGVSWGWSGWGEECADGS